MNKTFFVKRVIDKFARGQEQFGSWVKLRPRGWVPCSLQSQCNYVFK